MSTDLHLIPSGLFACAVSGVSCSIRQLSAWPPRLDPMKGHDVFVKAAEILLSRRPNAAFVCVGEGEEPHRSTVLQILKSTALGERLRWHGLMQDMPAFYSALTVATCPSRFGEGFSNAVAKGWLAAYPAQSQTSVTCP